MESRVLRNYGDLCGESPIWSVQEQALYWADITGRRLYRYSWTTQVSEMLLQDFEVTGIGLHADGGLVLANSAGLWYLEIDKEPKPLLANADGRKCSFNDCIADQAGRIFSGTCFFDPNTSDYPLGFLVRVDMDGTAHIVDEGFRLANGLGFSPDCSVLYFTDSAERTIYAYDYSALSGEIRNRRVFAQVPVERGLPDGMTVDAEGWVWSAHWFGGCIVRYDPDGRERLVVHVPATQTSSVAFGGPNLTDIFVTSARLSDALSLSPKHYRADDSYTGGALFHLESPYKGKPEFKARVSVASMNDKMQ